MSKPSEDELDRVTSDLEYLDFFAEIHRPYSVSATGSMLVGVEDSIQQFDVRYVIAQDASKGIERVLFSKLHVSQQELAIMANENGIPSPIPVAATLDTLASTDHFWLKSNPASNVQSFTDEIDKRRTKVLSKLVEEGLIFPSNVSYSPFAGRAQLTYTDCWAKFVARNSLEKCLTVGNITFCIWRHKISDKVSLVTRMVLNDGAPVYTKESQEHHSGGSVSYVLEQGYCVAEYRKSGEHILPTKLIVSAPNPKEFQYEITFQFQSGERSTAKFFDETSVGKIHLY